MAEEDREDLEPTGGIGEPEPIAPEEGELEKEPIAETGEATKAEAGQPQEPQRIDLTQNEDFRKWQRERDREREQLRRELAARDERMRELERQLEDLSLQDADPEQRVAYLQGKLAKERAERERAEQLRIQQERLSEEAYALLDDLGIDPRDPLLQWPEEISPQGLAKLAANAAKLAAQRARESQEETKMAARQKAREAEREALKKAGAAQASTATGSTRQSLDAEYKRRLKALQGSKDFEGLLNLREEFRRKGLDI